MPDEQQKTETEPAPEPEPEPEPEISLIEAVVQASSLLARQPSTGPEQLRHHVVHVIYPLLLDHAEHLTLLGELVEGFDDDDDDAEDDFEFLAPETADFLSGLLLRTSELLLAIYPTLKAHAADQLGAVGELVTAIRSGQERIANLRMVDEDDDG